MENFEIWSSEVWHLVEKTGSETDFDKLCCQIQIKRQKEHHCSFLSSMPPLLGTESEGDRKKPAIVKFYDFRFWFKYLFLAQSPLMYLFDMKLF